MSFIESSITGAIKWDIFVFYIVSGLIFVTCICVIGEIAMVVNGEELNPFKNGSDNNQKSNPI